LSAGELSNIAPVSSKKLPNEQQIERQRETTPCKG